MALDERHILALFEADHRAVIDAAYRWAILRAIGIVDLETMIQRPVENPAWNRVVISAWEPPRQP